MGKKVTRSVVRKTTSSTTPGSRCLHCDGGRRINIGIIVSVPT